MQEKYHEEIVVDCVEFDSLLGGEYIVKARSKRFPLFQFDLYTKPWFIISGDSVIKSYWNYELEMLLGNI